MRPIASARPNDIHVYVNGKRFPHITTNSEIVEDDIIQKIINVAYEHATINNRQILYAMIGERCWIYKDRELSAIISKIKEKRPDWAQQIINSITM